METDEQIDGMYDNYKDGLMDEQTNRWMDRPMTDG